MDIVDLLYHQLTRALERGYPGGPERPPTIGEIYQHLIPYRSVRGELGIWELAEYEHALLRLLAGEHGHLAVEKPEVRDELQRELASPNPILGIYRDYAPVQVRVGAAAISAAPASPPEPPREEPTPEEPPREEPTMAVCRSCATPLPDVPGLRFCPACGADQLEVRCRACEAPLKPEWNFCIRCGEARAR
jgi:Double zinc ribbon